MDYIRHTMCDKLDATLHVRIPQELLDTLRKLGRPYCRRPSDLVRQAVVEMLQRENGKPTNGRNKSKTLVRA